MDEVGFLKKVFENMISTIMKRNGMEPPKVWFDRLPGEKDAAFRERFKKYLKNKGANNGC